MTKFTVRITRVTRNLDAYHIDVEAETPEAARQRVEEWCAGNDSALTDEEMQSERHIKDYGIVDGESPQIDYDHEPIEVVPQ